MTDEPSLEQRLGASLATLRPVDGAPVALRARVLGIADERRSSWLARPPRLAVTVLCGAVIAALSLTVLLGPLHGNLGVGSGNEAPAPSASLFDPTAEGPGVLYGVLPTLLIVPGLIAAVAILLAVRHLRRARWIGGWIGALQLLALVTIAAGAVGLMLHPGFEWRGGVIGPVIGYDLQQRPPPGSLDDVEVWYENVSPGDPLVILVSITNPGPLPIRIEALVEDPNAKDMVITRWVGMTALPDPRDLPDIANVPAFAPVTVEPNDQLYVYLAAKAGPCSFGPAFSLDMTDFSDLSGYSNRGRIINFAYSVFGLESTAPFELPVTLVEPLRNRCP